jgi:hypothetical protein
MVTNQEHLNNLVVAAFHREMEIYQYQINVDNYAVMIAALPQESWPDDLVQYKEAAIDKLPESLDDDAVLTISEHQYRDRIRNLLRTERVEQSKAVRVRDALKAQIGADYDALVAAYKASQQQNA